MRRILAHSPPSGGGMSGTVWGASVWQSNNSPKPVCPTAKPLRIQPHTGRQGKRFFACLSEFGGFRGIRGDSGQGRNVIIRV